MKKKFLRAGAWLAATLLLLAGGIWWAIHSLEIDKIPRADPHATTADLAYLRHAVKEQRGRILAVVTSTAQMGGGKKQAGYELTELARAYYVFQANGYQVDIASPAGGTPPVVIDDEDMGQADFAFLNDKAAQAKVEATLRLADVDPARYAAVYFVGGKGAMFDFPGNPDVARIVAAVEVVGAVCHGPAALIGLPMLAGRHVAAFSNEEELFLNKDARAMLPFMLEERLKQEGARYSKGSKYLNHTVRDARLVTGQNPWSTWAVAEGMIAALGHEPVARAPTPEEHSVRLLATYHRNGLSAALAEQATVPHFDKMLVLMHAVVAGMEWRLLDAYNLQRLARSQA